MKISAFFLKKQTYTHARIPPSSCSLSFAFQRPHSFPQRMYFLNDPLSEEKRFAVLAAKFVEKVSDAAKAEHYYEIFFNTKNSKKINFQNQKLLKTQKMLT